MCGCPRKALVRGQNEEDLKGFPRPSSWCGAQTLVLNQRTEVSALAKDGSAPGGPCLEQSRFLSHFPPGLEQCAIKAPTVSRCTVIIRLVLSLERTDGQGGHVAGPRAGESVRDP